jgi:hypothetical protein
MDIWPRRLAPRFGKEQPCKFLVIDGSGLRGVLSLEILAWISRQIIAETGLQRIRDYFDYVGRTSTSSSCWYRGYGEDRATSGGDRFWTGLRWTALSVGGRSIRRAGRIAMPGARERIDRLRAEVAAK